MIVCPEFAVPAISWNNQTKSKSSAYMRIIWGQINDLVSQLLTF